MTNDTLTSPGAGPAPRTLEDFIRSLPQERINRIADDEAEGAVAEQEFAELIAPNPEAPSASTAVQPAAPVAAPATVAPVNSFDTSSDREIEGYLSGLQKRDGVLFERISRAEPGAWEEAVQQDADHNTRFQSEGISDLSDGDFDYFRWAKHRGLLESNESVVTAFGRGLWNLGKGAYSFLDTVSQAKTDFSKAIEAGATMVEGAQAAKSEYEQLGAGVAALTAKRPNSKTLADQMRFGPYSAYAGGAKIADQIELEGANVDPALEDAAQFELARFAQGERQKHGQWREAIAGKGFAAVPVDENAVEFVSEAFDPSNLLGAGLGKATVKQGLIKGLINEKIAKAALYEVPNPLAKVFHTPGLLAPLEGQARVLSEQSIAAKAAMSSAEAKLSSAKLTMAHLAQQDRAAFLKETVAPLQASAEAARNEFVSVSTKLETNRAAVTAALDGAGVSGTESLVGGAFKRAGRIGEWSGEKLTKGWSAVKEAAGGADEAADVVVNTAADAATGGATAVLRKGNLVTRVGRDLKVVGELYQQGEATLPFFRRLRQAEKASKITRGAAAFIDSSQIGWTLGKVGEYGKAAAAGTPVSAAFGYAASGGDVSAAAESAGSGAAYGIGGGGLGQFEAYANPAIREQEIYGNRRTFRQWLSDSGDKQSQLKLFDQLGSNDQLLIATYAHAQPDVSFIFERGERSGPAGYYDREQNTIVVNTAHPDPVSKTFAHEIAHAVERHGLTNQVRDALLGNAETGQIGQYTAIDPLGNPVLEEVTNPDGEKTFRYQLNFDGAQLKNQYEVAVQKFRPDFKMSDEAFASELFAEQYADRVLSGEIIRDLKSSPVDALMNASWAKGFLAKAGLLFDGEGKVQGTGLFTNLAKNKSIEKVIAEYNRQSGRGLRSEVADESDLELTEEQLKNSENAVRWLQAGGAMQFGPDGKPVYTSDGRPKFLTAKEADAIQKDLAEELKKAIDEYHGESTTAPSESTTAAPSTADGGAIRKRELVDVNGRKSVIYSGSYIPEEVIAKLEAQNKFNPHQLAFLRAASRTIRDNGAGAMAAHFYQAATRKNSGQAYRSVSGRWRRDGLYGFRITKDGNVLLQSFSWEQLFENARKASKLKLARELWGTSGQALDAAIAGDAVTYLRNVERNDPGADGIGEAKRDFINNLLGLRTKASEGVNPLHETTAQPKTIITSLRLDRMNRFTPLDTIEYAWGPEQYRQAMANLSPGTTESPAPEVPGTEASPVRGPQEAIRALDEAGTKDATQVDPSSLKHPANPVPGSVALVPRWGLVNRKIAGMPRDFAEVESIVDRAVRRLRHTADRNPEFAKESARFYSDMAESAGILADVVKPGVADSEKVDLTELMLRFLALGSPRTSVSGNATKASGSAAAVAGDFAPGFKLGFGSQQLGAKETYAAWARGEHFNLEAPGIDDKVRSFYVNALSEQIEALQKAGSTEDADRLLLKAGKSLSLVPANAASLTREHVAEVQRLLDGKGTIDMWDMAAKGFAWPGFILRKSERNAADQPFQWSQDDFAKGATLADPTWKTVRKDLEITSPSDLRYQQARALRIDGNRDWTDATWAERVQQPFGPETPFTYFSQGTEAGLTPGGAGPLYDAQQAIDGLIADRLNELGLAEMFGKEKLKARNAQEILWAQEKMDNPVRSNNDLSLFGATFKSLKAEVAKLRLGQQMTKASRAEAVLGAMDRAFNTMARQEMPVEVVTTGQTDTAHLIRSKIAELASDGVADPEATITRAVADGLGDTINDIAIRERLDVTIDEVHLGRGGYTEGSSVSVSPNMRLILRGDPANTRVLLNIISRALDQSGGNIFRKPTVRELNDAKVRKNMVATFDTRTLNELQRDSFFHGLSALRDSEGRQFFTGFTETSDGIAVGDQFYDGDLASAIVTREAELKALLTTHRVPGVKIDQMIIETYNRGDPETQSPFATALTNRVIDRIRGAGVPSTDFPQTTNHGELLRKRSAAGVEAAAEKSPAGRTATLADLKAQVDAALLRGSLDPETAGMIKAAIPSK